MCKTLSLGMCILNLPSYPLPLTQNTSGMANGDRMHNSFLGSFCIFCLILMLKSIYSLDNVILKQRIISKSKSNPKFSLAGGFKCKSH